MDKPKPRRWFCFSLRTIFVVVTMGCTLLAWTVYQLNWIRERRKAMAEVPHYQIVYKDLTAALKKGPSAPCTIAIFGEKGVREIWARSGVPAADVNRLRRLFPEAKVTQD